MDRITVDFSKEMGNVKPMHSVNNGPVYKFAKDQRITNIDHFRAAGIPYARNHDASFLSTYGGEHTVDVNMIFTDWSRDAEDPEAYDFVLTDEYLRVIEAGGSKVFYRLGQTIEHAAKKYYIHPPKDYKKWAVICEHIIRHYNEGWADGFFHGIEYWEIWNEPDLNQDNNSPTWSGTKEQFFDFYEVVSKYLKEKFPTLKIGGPAAVGLVPYMVEFVNEMKNRNVPLDFFSWHKYDCVVEKVIERINFVRNLLDEAGYEKTESILNEWAYIKSWGSRFVYSLECIAGLKGASFVTGVMTSAQYAPLDMLMYYDASPGAIFNGLFEYLSMRPLKTYYAMYGFADLAELGEAVEVSSCENVYCMGATDGKRHGILLTHYNDDDNAESKQIELCWNGMEGKYRVSFYKTDANRNSELVNEMIMDGASSAEWHTNIGLYDIYYIDIAPIE